MELFKIRPPSPDCGATNLYIRVKSGVSVFIENSCKLNPGSEISTDTYFNIFSSSKYSKYTRVRKVSVTTLVSGKLDVELRSVSSIGEKTIETINIDSKDTKSVTFSFDISDLNDDNPVCHYLNYRSTGISVIESFGSYVSDVVPDSVSLGIVICTFKREDRVLKNINCIKQMISDKSYGISDSIAIYVIDNGRTLERESVENDFVKLVPNRNDGGSGGFSRGMMECKQDCKSHILLMDDDIELDPNTIYKTFKFISILSQDYKDVFVLGGMLLPNDPCMQFEAGARYLEGFRRGKHMLNLADVNHLLLNEKWEHADYGGWWYMCMPAGAADELSLPMFIKLDDVEFGIRRMRNHVIINGVGIWHDSFESKVNPITDYYFLKRNALIIRALHSNRSGPSINIDYMRTTLRFLREKNSDGFFYTQMAVNDFMAGPDFIKNTNQADLLHTDSAESISTYGKDSLCIKFYKLGLFGKLISAFLQGGHLSARWSKVRKQYREEAEYLSSYEFWKGRQ